MDDVDWLRICEAEGFRNLIIQGADVEEAHDGNYDSLYEKVGILVNASLLLVLGAEEQGVASVRKHLCFIQTEQYEQGQHVVDQLSHNTHGRKVSERSKTAMDLSLDNEWEGEGNGEEHKITGAAAK